MAAAFDFLTIIPAYKKNTVEAAIISALGQDGVTKMIIVMDDHPQYLSESIAMAFPDIIYVKNSNPTGGWPGIVRNLAWDHARSIGIKADYVHFLDDDDTIPKEHYAFIKRTFERHPDVGVVFGVMKPFCVFTEDSSDTDRRARQLRAVTDWRLQATSYPWLYQKVANKIPVFGKWLFRLHALSGAEMFLCAGGVIRYEHFVELGRFPPHIRVTQDYYFFTRAIRQYGCLFVERVTAGYGVGDPTSIWNPPDDMDEAVKEALLQEWTAELATRRQDIRAELGNASFQVMRVLCRLQIIVFSLLISVLQRYDYFAKLRNLINDESDVVVEVAVGQPTSLQR